MITTLPIVTKDTALGAACDLIRGEMESLGEGHGVLMEWALVVARENPEITETVNWMMSESSQEQKLAALIGMAVTYNALKAQAEVELLEGMAT